jgi:hypothetical protein
MPNTHTIWKQVLEVETSDPTAKVGFEREVELWYKETLLPRMGELFDRCAGPNTLLRTEKMEIMVTLPLTKNWKENLCESVLRELNQNLQSLAPLHVSTPDGTENAFGINHPVLVDPRTPPAIAYWQERMQPLQKKPVLSADASAVFLQFLQTGTLPWFGKQWSNADLVKQIIRAYQEAPGLHASFIKQLMELLGTNPMALLRCLHQFGETLLKALFGETIAYKGLAPWRFILVSASSTQEMFWRAVLQQIDPLSIPLTYLLKSLPAGYIERWWTEDASAQQQGKLWKALDLGPPAQKNMTEVLEAIQRLPAQKAQASKPLQKPRSVTEEIQDEGVYVDNAGMVILHPFLNPLFSALNYWDGKKFISDSLHQRAVLLSQYLLQPGDEFPEHQLLLNKVLCGYDLETTLPSALLCTEDEQFQTAELLEAVLKYWKLNGNQVCTTVDNLQVSFLQRPGKLIRKQSEWLLIVEKRGYDIVLKGLPWSIGMIKHPWMSDMLKVEWV